MLLADGFFAWAGWGPWVWFLLLVSFVWLRRHIEINAAHRERILTPADAIGDDALPALSVLVAAKDEEKNIARCVAGLLTQQYAPLQVIVANDRSTDETGAIIDEFAARDPRFTAVHVKELPAGWFGKNNAMREGLLRATGDYYCFSDADCAFDAPELLAAAVRLARREKIDFLSVLPRLEAGTFWEYVVQPVAGAIMVFWFPPRSVNNPRSACAYANGAFMLMSRQAYAALGGHEFAKATLNEDMHFARRAKAVGLKLQVIRSSDMYRVRMYTGWTQIWRGWSRIFYGCFGTLPRLLVSVLFLSLFSLSPYLSLLLAPLAGADAWRVALAAIVAATAQQSILWRFYRLSGVAPAWALTYPIGAAVCLGMTLNAMRRLFGAQTTWRGTTYSGGAHAGAPGAAA